MLVQHRPNNAGYVGPMLANFVCPMIFFFFCSLALRKPKHVGPILAHRVGPTLAQRKEPQQSTMANNVGPTLAKHNDLTLGHCTRSYWDNVVGLRWPSMLGLHMLNEPDKLCTMLGKSWLKLQ